MKCPKCKADNPDDAIYCGQCQTRIQDKLVFDETQDDMLGGNSKRRGGEAQSRTLAAGELFADRFEIKALIGEGGMGVVYRAYDKVTDREVALKLIRTDRLAGTDAVKRLIREGVTSRDIRHPNVVSVYDVGESRGQPFLSMEHLQGRSLHQWNRERLLKDANCSMKTASRIIEEILQGLQAAHSAGVVHRDLKPENVMLLSEPNDQGVKLKILDFGVARAPGTGDTGSTGLGTPRYMAPEQTSAPDAARPSADLYSLSVMFYELLVNALPQGHWQPPSRGRNDVPPGIDALIEKGLANRASSRPQSVLDYAHELGAAQTSGGGGGIAAGSFMDWLRKVEKELEDLGKGRGGGGFRPLPLNNGPTPQPSPPPPPVQAGNMNLWSWFMHGFTKRYADGRGRAHRKEYWGFTLGAVALAAIAGGADIAIYGEYAVSEGTAPASVVTLLALIVPSFAVTSRRFHDLGLSGWLAVVAIIPPFGFLVGLHRGTQGGNAYGPDPLMAVAA